MKKIFFIFVFILININPAQAINFDSFDLNDISAIKNATKQFQKEFKNIRGTDLIEDYFIEFKKYYYNFANIQNKKIKLSQTFSNLSIKKQIQFYSKKYYKYGLSVQFDEGEFMLTPSNKYLYKNFSKYLSKPSSELLKYNSSDKRIISDGRYIISKKELLKYIEFYENFEQKYPEYSKKNNIKEIINKYKEDLKYYPYIIY